MTTQQILATSPGQEGMTRQSWRDVLKVHPAADKYPLLDPDNLQALAADIDKNGLREPVIINFDAPDKNGGELFDGRNRLDALERNGVQLVRNGRIDTALPYWKQAGAETIADPGTFIDSLNLHRRHLTGEQKRELVAALIKANPEKSSRQIAKLADVSPTTEVKVRDDLVASGDVSKMDTSIDTKGRHQPTHKIEPTAPASPPELSSTQDPAAVSVAASKPSLKPSAPKSTGLRLPGKEIDAVHRIASNGMDITPKDVLASLDSEAKRINLLGSVRQARGWLDGLLKGDPA